MREDANCVSGSFGRQIRRRWRYTRHTDSLARRVCGSFSRSDRGHNGNRDAEQPCSESAISIYASYRNCRRSEEHTSELQSLMRISYAVFCLKKKTKKTNNTQYL